MTDSNSTYGEEGADSSTESKPNWRRDLENRVKEAEARAAAAEGQLSGYQRQDTFRSAGIDLDDPRSQYFMKGYEGEMDADAIRAEAEAAGFMGANAEASVPTSPMMQNTLNAEERIAVAGEGGDPVSQADLNARIQATKNPEELRALMESEGYMWGAAI